MMSIRRDILSKRSAMVDVGLVAMFVEKRIDERCTKQQQRSANENHVR
jgi:hypothetical protein